MERVPVTALAVLSVVSVLGSDNPNRFFFLLGTLAAGALCAHIAGRKNRSRVAWGAAGIAFGITPLIPLAFVRKL